MDMDDYINQRWHPKLHYPSNTEERKTMIASKDKKRKYANRAKKEAEESLPPYP
jgi:hypothetical protein